MARTLRISLFVALMAVVCIPAWGQSARRGAVIGGIGGAVIGGAIGADRGRAGRGALIGGAIGAASGAAIGSARQRSYYGSQGYYHVPQVMQPRFGVPVQSYYRTGQPYYRTVQPYYRTVQPYYQPYARFYRW